MEINGVSQRPDALLQQSALPGREVRSAETPPRPAPSPPVEASPKVEPKREEPPEPPKPVVNTSGQTTGTRVNTTA